MLTKQIMILGGGGKMKGGVLSMDASLVVIISANLLVLANMRPRRCPAGAIELTPRGTCFRVN